MKRLCALLALGVLLSGCFVAPLALVGPATSGFSTASLIQSGGGATGNYIMKEKTGRTITEHVLSVLDINPLVHTKKNKKLRYYNLYKC